MFENEVDFKKLVDRLDIDTELNVAHREKLRREMLSAFSQTHEPGAAKRAGGGRWQNVIHAIFKSRIVKLAAAAVIIIAAFLVFDFTGAPEFASITWADVCRASSQVETVHAVQSMIGEDGKEIVQGDFWFKRPNLFRQERRDGAMLVIDSGDKRLTIDRAHQGYQFSDPRPTETHAFFSWLGFLQAEEDLDDSLLDEFGEVPKLEPVPVESTDDTIVYEVNSPTATLEKVWVHRATGLVQKLVWTEVTTSGSQNVIRVKRGTTKFVWTFDYDPIPDEMFSMVIPEGYAECEW